MPRRPRVHLDGVPLHIVQRGHNREPCCFSDEDYHSYLHWLAVALKETGCALHAYVLMTNHVHLLLTPMKAEAVPTLLIALGPRYVQYINRSYRANGLGQADRRLTPHALYRAIGQSDTARQAAYRGLFRAHLDEAALDDIRLALNQCEPLGNARFLLKIEQTTGQRREPKPRGRPTTKGTSNDAAAAEQGKLAID